jgi:hypothetical protein
MQDQFNVDIKKILQCFKSFTESTLATYIVFLTLSNKKIEKGIIAFDKSFHTHWSKQFRTISIVHCTMLMMPFTEKDKTCSIFTTLKTYQTPNGIQWMSTHPHNVNRLKLVDISCTSTIHDCFPCS